MHTAEAADVQACILCKLLGAERSHVAILNDRTNGLHGLLSLYFGVWFLNGAFLQHTCEATPIDGVWTADLRT